MITSLVITLVYLPVFAKIPVSWQFLVDLEYNEYTFISASEITFNSFMMEVPIIYKPVH